MRLKHEVSAATRYINHLLGLTAHEAAGWNVHRRQFVVGLVLSVLAAGSTLLSGMVRAWVLGGTTHKHLYKNVDRMLGELDLRPVAAEQMAVFGSEVGDDWVIAFDPSDITKEYARKMEALAPVHDGSRGRVCGHGYKLMAASAFPLGYRERSVPLPLLLEVHSSAEEDFKSEPALELDALERLCDHVPKGTFVIDRGADNGRIFDKLIARNRDFVIRVKAGGGSRTVLIDDKRRKVVADAWKEARMWGEMTVERLSDSAKNKPYRCEYGSLRVRLPKHPHKQLWLCVYDSPDHKQPLVVLTSKPAETAEQTQKVLEIYFSRWTEEEMHRWTKQSFGLEQVRLLTWHRLQNMVAAVWLAMGVIAAQRPAEAVVQMAIKALRARTKKKPSQFLGYLLADFWRMQLNLAARFLPMWLSGSSGPDPQLDLPGLGA